ncbi:MAG: Spi family protease inhibitor, partial [Burkholderiales bacterium]
MKQGTLDQQTLAQSARKLGVRTLLSFLAILAAFAEARPVAEDVARRVALNFAQQHIATTGSWEGSQRVEVESISQLVFDGKAVAHLVRIKPSGYLLVSADDDLAPVIVYSPNGKFDPLEAANFGSLESWILPETRTRLESIGAKRNDSIASGEELTFESLRSGSEVARAWEFFDVDQGAFVPFQARFLQKTSTIDGQFKAGSVGPLLRTTWNQGDD